MAGLVLAIFRLRKNEDTYILFTGLPHTLAELLLQLFGHGVGRVEPESLVEVIEGLAVVAWPVLLRTLHNEGGVIESVKRGEVGAVGSFLGGKASILPMMRWASSRYCCDLLS